MFPNSKMPTESQRQELCKMIHEAFLEMRILGWEGKAEQAADLADAFHELPLCLWSKNFSLDFYREFLQTYSEKYPTSWGQQYLKKLNDIRRLDTCDFPTEP